jgi:hypothetical protein
MMTIHGGYLTLLSIGIWGAFGIAEDPVFLGSLSDVRGRPQNRSFGVQMAKHANVGIEEIALRDQEG